MPTRPRTPPKPPEEEEVDVVTTTGEGNAGGGGGGGADGGGDGDGGMAGDEHIRDIVRDVVEEFLAGGRSDGGEGGGRLIDDERRIQRQVEKELERVKAASSVDELREQVKAIIEKPPVKWRRSTRAMGWVTEDDR